MFKAIIDKIKTDRLFFRGQNKTRHGDYTESIDLYNRAIAISPKEPWLYLHKAISLASFGSYDEAIDLVKKAINIDGKKHAYYLYLGIFQFDSGSYEESIKSFNKALELSHENSIAICYKCLIDFISGRDAIESLNKILKHVRSTNSDYMGRLLVHCESALFKNKDIARSLEECLLDITKMPSQPHFKNYKFEELLCRIRYMFNHNNKMAHLYQLEAKMHLSKGAVDLAVDNYHKSIGMQPNLQTAREELLQLFTTHKRYESFFDYIDNTPEFKKVSSLLDDGNNLDSNKKERDQIVINNSAIILAASQLYYQMGNYEKSYKFFKLLSENHSKEYYIQYYCGLCCIAMNNIKEASLYFKKSMEIINPKVVEKRLSEMMRCYS